METTTIFRSNLNYLLKLWLKVISIFYGPESNFPYCRLSWSRSFRQAVRYNRPILPSVFLRLTIPDHDSVTDLFISWYNFTRNKDDNRYLLCTLLILYD